MKVALVLLLLALVIIPDSEGWRRFRFRFRLPLPRVRKVFKKVFRPVVKVLKPVVRKVIKKVKEEVVVPTLQAGVALALATNPHLKPLHAKACQRDLSDMSPRSPIGDQLQDAGESLEERGVHGDDVTVRDEGDVEDELEKYLQEGRGLEGLKSLVRDERDVREIHKLLADPVRSKRLGKLVGEVLCGPAPAPDQQQGQNDNDRIQVITVPVTEIQYVTGAPVTEIEYVTEPPKQANSTA